MLSNRADFRTNNQSRLLVTDTSTIKECDSSASISVGNTSVVVALYGPSTPKYSRLEQHDKLTVEVDMVRDSQHSQKLSMDQLHRQEKVVCKYVSMLVQNCVLVHEYPRLLMYLRVSVLRNDGSLLSTILNACSIALMCSNVKLSFVPISITIATMSSEESSGDVIVVADPSLEEENICEASCMYTYKFSSDDNAGLLMCNCSGELEHMSDDPRFCERMASAVYRDVTEQF